MRYLFDSRSGQIRGTFTVEFDFDLDNDIDYLLFKFDERTEYPSLQVEGTQFYADFANIVHPSSVALLDRDWIPFNEFEYFRQASDKKIYDDELLLELAAKIGPLFGSDDEQGDLMTPHEIREPISCWFAAAHTLNFAIRAQAYLTERSGSANLDDEVYYLLHTDKNEVNYWECRKFFGERLSEPYLNMLSLTGEEHRKLFIPTSDNAFPGVTFLTRWESESHVRNNLPTLSVSIIPDGMTTPTAPVAYTTQHYMAVNTETEPVAHATLAHMVRSLVLLHTHRIYHDLHDGFFGVAYNNLLERLWCCFAADAALGKLGVCEQCGRVFEAMSERRNRKRFCSVECQEQAKSARNYRKRKIREAAEYHGAGDIDYLVHVLDDPKITREMVESVVEGISPENR